MLTKNGYITIWQGEEVNPECVEVFAHKAEERNKR
jgi:hypothetical protein